MAVILIVLCGVGYAQLVSDAHPSVPAIIAVIALQILHSLPGRRRLRTWWTVAAQLLLAHWAGLWEAPAASILLLTQGRQRLRWVLFGGVVAAAAVDNLEDAFEATASAGDALAVGLVLFSLTWISDLRAELRESRSQLAAQAVAAERRRAARRLEGDVGAALSSILKMVAEGRARQIAETARAAASRARGAGLPQPAEATGPEATAEPDAPAATGEGPRGTHGMHGTHHGHALERLERLETDFLYPVVVVAHLQYLLVGVLYVRDHTSPDALPGVYVGILAATTALQIYHWVLLPSGVLPRLAVVTLPLQLALACWFLFAPDRCYPQLIPFALGVVLMVLPYRRTAWAVCGIVGAAVPLVLALRGAGTAEVVHGTVATVTQTTLFYGLALLIQLARQAQEARLVLAGAAAAMERRRISRDVHDLLGSGLSAIAMKAEVAVGIPDRAQQELAEIGGLARRTLVDLRAVPAEAEVEIDLSEELASAARVLASAGIAADVATDLDPARLPAPVNTALGTALREAVTNVLRHSRARHCSIVLDTADGGAVLRIANDGVSEGASAPAGPGGREPHEASRVPDGNEGPYGRGRGSGSDSGGGGGGGQGLGNLQSRLAALGGTLTVGPSGPGSYSLTARGLPLQRTPDTD